MRSKLRYLREVSVFGVAPANQADLSTNAHVCASALEVVPTPRCGVVLHFGHLKRYLGREGDMPHHSPLSHVRVPANKASTRAKVVHA
jgi:hypothetical protein